MNLSHHGQQQEPESTSGDAALVVPLDTLDRTSLLVAGGKASNLGELIQAGFAVPAGFCVTTTVYARVSARVGLDTYLSGLEAAERSDSARQIELATAIRTALGQAPPPPEVSEAITRAYQALSAGLPIPVSVRSSATAEDLPDASFAGQQETFLNVIGISLWGQPGRDRRTAGAVRGNRSQSPLDGHAETGRTESDGSGAIG